MIRLLFLLAAGLLALAGVSLRAEPAGTVEDIPVTVSPVQVATEGGGLPFVLDDTSPTRTESTANANEWVVVPVPFTSPLLGFGVAGGAAYIYHPPDSDRTMPPWTSGVGLFYSENKSWGVAFGHKMNLHHDAWRLNGLAGFGQVNYDFYGIGDDAGSNSNVVSLSQTVSGVTGEGLFRIREHFYAGLNYSLSRIVTRYSGNTLPPWINDIVSRGQLSALLSTPALRVQWDSRDSSFLPTHGSLIDGELAFSDERFGSDFTFQALSLSAKHYWSVAPQQTVAVYGFGRFAFGDVPFFALSMIGAKGNLRGYPAGRYQDRMVLTGQVEYRWQVWRRLGVVAFGGVGAVAPELGDFRHATALPSGGFGARYLLTESNKINFRVDVAWGRDERIVYVGVGEAF